MDYEKVWSLDWADGEKYFWKIAQFAELNFELSQVKFTFPYLEESWNSEEKAIFD